MSGFLSDGKSRILVVKVEIAASHRRMKDDRCDSEKMMISIENYVLFFISLCMKRYTV
jgi:hypothetical protein